MSSLDRRNDARQEEAAIPGEVRRWRAFSLLAVAFFMTIVDLTITNGALATTDTFLIIMRGLQGLGAAVVLPAALSIVMNMFPEGAERNKALSALGRHRRHNGRRAHRRVPVGVLGHRAHRASRRPGHLPAHPAHRNSPRRRGFPATRGPRTRRRRMTRIRQPGHRPQAGPAQTGLD